MLNKHNLSIAKFCEKSGGTHPAFENILVTDEFTAMTDGHVLLKVTRPTFPPEAFPTTEGGPKPIGKHKPFLLPGDQALKILKDLPKKTPIPILACAAVCEEQNGETPIVCTDLQNTAVHKAKRGASSFPDIERVIPRLDLDIRPIRFKVTVNAQKLKKIMDFVESFKKDIASDPHCQVEFSFMGERDVIRMDAVSGDQHMIACLMPVVPKQAEGKKT